MAKNKGTKGIPQKTDAEIEAAFGGGAVLGSNSNAESELNQSKLIEAQTKGAADPTDKEIQEALLAVYTDGTYLEGKRATKVDEHFAKELEGVTLRRTTIGHGKRQRTIAYALHASDCGELTTAKLQARSPRFDKQGNQRLSSEGEDLWTTLSSTLWFNKVSALANKAADYIMYRRAEAEGLDLKAQHTALSLALGKGYTAKQKREYHSLIDHPFKVDGDDARKALFEAAKTFVAELERKERGPSKAEIAREALSDKDLAMLKRIEDAIKAAKGQ